ncbi:MAG: TonB-dependent receptor [Bacteroidales bacterium]|nr:TonB-dependent receptor [Bacteroidales bacterium]
MIQSIKKGIAAVVAAFVGIAAFAQVTTSSLAGTIKDDTGEPLTGAAVVAVHTPSGTQYAAVANIDGNYTINGMRVGGPYKVTISFLGYQTIEYTDVTLQLAETFNLNAQLKADNEMLESSVVIASPASKLAVEKTGAATNINNQQIANLPTVNRSITDVTRLSPYGGNGTTFAGMDGRSSNFTVDGANFNNNFGLSSGLPGGGNPISIDAIEELQVVISPYDVRQTNFIGGGINAITKSGTNTFKGSAYMYHRNENLRGDTIEGEQISGARDKDRNTTYGFTFGGPIIKNKLFFFLNAEQSKIPTIVNRWRGSEDGKANANDHISRTKLSDLKAVSDFVKSKYGYDTGSWTDFPADEDNTKLLARIDWNISNNHHLAVRYNYTLNNAWNSPNATSMDGGTRMSGARMSQYSMSYANSMYAARNMVSTWSFDLNSRLSESLSNQFLATYSKVQNPIRSSTSEEFPFIDILDDTQENNYMALGYELFTWNNAVNEINYNIKDDLTYYAGAHKIMGGINYEYQMADNQYMRNGSGYYRYKSVSDFMSGATPEIVCLTYGYDGEQKPAARVRFHKLGVYVQDEWNATDKFKLTLGARIDGLFFDDGDLMTNEAIKALTYYPKAKDYAETHIDTGQWPNGTVTISPRLGFSWDVLGDKSLKVRGGSGFFSGRLPLVFFTNMPTNGGLVQYQAQINAKSAAAKGFSMDTFAGGLVTDSNGKATIDALYKKLISLGYPSTVSPKDGTVPSSISAVDPDFKMPQIWKTSLAVDYSFPTAFPMSVTAEGIFNKTINGVSISDWSMSNVGGFARFNGVDNRPIYPSGFRNATKAFVLENTSKGYGWTGNVTFNVRPVEGVSFMAAYTHTVSKEITGMPGSAAESAFTYVPTSEGPNYIKLHNSQYVTPDRVVAALDLSDRSGNHFDFIYETWRGGYKESYMLTNDMNGDGYAYDTIYIPTDEEVSSNKFRFVNADSRDRFMDYVHKDKYMSKNQGRYAEPYTVYSPWVHRIDFSYKHDFTVKVGNSKNTLQLGFDLKNALNLFNSSWGVSKHLNPEIGTEARILKYEGVDADGFATFSTPASISGSTETFVPFHELAQCWYASIGIKYLFN